MVFCFILFCRITYDPFCSVEINTATFHVCMKVHCCKKHVCERKTLSGQPNTFVCYLYRIHFRSFKFPTNA